MSLAPGSRLGAYEIVAPLGAGGMGEVHRARDLTLHRDVAIKTLPDLFVADTDRMVRFEREAHTLAALNHPNIAQIHGLIGKDEGGPALVMELVEGEDLAQRLARGAIPLEDALPIARQIADALQAAHEQGIVHRDLKPANVRVRPDGTVKVLDFGLAKALAPPDASGPGMSPDPRQMNSPTFTSPARLRPGYGEVGTEIGVILGTAAYMAPEQARGRAVDKRADIWAFGCVLFEMLTARQAFRGDSVTDLVAAIVKDDPEWSALPPSTPRSIRRLLERCLRKEPRQRLHDIADARIDIEDALDDHESADLRHDTATPRTQTAVISLAALSMVLLLVSGYLGWRTLRPVAAVPSVSFAVQPPRGTELTVDWPAAALSPDGSRMVITAGQSSTRTNLYLRDFGSVDLKMVEGTKDGYNPFFSPDGRWIAFTADQKLKKVPVTGGQPQVLTDAEWGGGTWGPGDVIVYTPHYASGLWKVSSAGGKGEKLTEPDPKAGELGHWWPQFLPDGKHVVYTSFSTPVEKSRVMVYSIATGQQRVLVDGANFGRAIASGHLLYARSNGIAAVPFDLARAEVTGPEMPVLDDVSTYFTNGVAHVSVAGNGALAFVPEKEGRANSEIVWLDRKGTVTPALPAARRHTDINLSPDGRRLAVTIEDETRDVWVYDLDRGIFNRVTSGPASEFAPTWTPDGRRLLFAFERPVFNIFMKPPLATAPEAPMVTENFDTVPLSVSPDGRFLVYTVSSPVTRSDLWVRPLDGSGKAQVLMASKYQESGAQISPDGKWIAYTSDESGRSEAYVQAFPDPVDRWQVSTLGANRLRWSRDGRELLFGNGEASDIEAALITVQPDGSLSAAKPVTVYEGRFIDFDVAKDGRLLIVRRDPKAPTSSVHVVLNWFEELQRKFAAR